MKVLGLLVVLPILVGFTDAAITSWNLNAAGAQPGADYDFSSSSVAKDETVDDTVLLFTIVAAGDNTVTSYTITDPTGKFAIGAPSGGTNGEVKLASGQVLDRETDGASITVKIEAVDDDSAGNLATGTATVVLSINDVNDNTPVFSAPASSPHYVTIADASTAGAAVYTVIAADADATDNTITYSINSGNTNNDFTVDGTSGAITVATGQTLEKATTAVYTLVIHATDSGTPADSASATVIVVLCDSSENGTGNLAAGFLSFVITLLTCVTMVM